MKALPLLSLLALIPWIGTILADQHLNRATDELEATRANWHLLDNHHTTENNELADETASK